MFESVDINEAKQLCFGQTQYAKYTRSARSMCIFRGTQKFESFRTGSWDGWDVCGLAELQPLQPSQVTQACLSAAKKTERRQWNYNMIIICNHLKAGTLSNFRATLFNELICYNVCDAVFSMAHSFRSNKIYSLLLATASTLFKANSLPCLISSLYLVFYLLAKLSRDDLWIRRNEKRGREKRLRAGNI